MEIKTVSFNELKNSSASENISFDPDKRIDVNQKQDIKEISEYDIDKRIENSEIEHEVSGGSYSEVKKNSNGEIYEVHHMPSDTASPLDRLDGPTIKMEKEDHRQTASCGSSKDARDYQKNKKNWSITESFVRLFKWILMIFMKNSVQNMMKQFRKCSSMLIN